MTALATSRPPGGSAAQHASSSPSAVSAAADEHRVRRRQPGQRVRARPGAPPRSPGTPSAAGVAADPRRPGRRAASTATARASGSARIHSMPIAAAARADVPEQLAGPRRERGQGQRPHLALGQLAVVSRTRRRAARAAARGSRHPASARGRTPTTHRSAKPRPAAEPPPCRAGHGRAAAPGRRPLGRAAELLEHGQLAGAPAALRPAARPPRPGSCRRGTAAPPGRPGRSAGQRGLRRPRHERDHLGLVLRPAQPGAGQRDRRHVAGRPAAAPVRAAGPASPRCRAASGRRWPARTAPGGRRPAGPGAPAAVPAAARGAPPARRAAGRAAARCPRSARAPVSAARAAAPRPSQPSSPIPTTVTTLWPASSMPSPIGRPACHIACAAGGRPPRRPPYPLEFSFRW